MNRAKRLAKAHATMRRQQAEHYAMVRPHLEAHITAGLGVYDIARHLDAQGVKLRMAASWKDNRRSLHLIMQRLGLQAPDTRAG